MPFFGLPEVEEALRRVGQEMDQAVDAFVFGGGAMAAWEVKPATRDLDIAFRTRNEIEAFARGLTTFGASPIDTSPTREGGRRHLVTPDGMGWDLFHDNVIGFPLIAGDYDEAEPWLTTDRLSVWRFRPELVFVMKAFTPRTRDISDMYDLLRTGTVRPEGIAALVHKRVLVDPDQPWIAHFYHGVLDMAAERDVSIGWAEEFEDAAIHSLQVGRTRGRDSPARRDA